MRYALAPVPAPAPPRTTSMLAGPSRGRHQLLRGAQHGTTALAPTEPGAAELNAGSMRERTCTATRTWPDSHARACRWLNQRVVRTVYDPIHAHSRFLCVRASRHKVVLVTRRRVKVRRRAGGHSHQRRRRNRHRAAARRGALEAALLHKDGDWCLVAHGPGQGRQRGRVMFGALRRSTLAPNQLRSGEGGWRLLLLLLHFYI